MSLNCFFQNKHAMETITSVLMLLLVLAFMAGIIAFFVNSNLSFEQKMNADNERAQEQIVITQITANSQGKIANVTIRNTGATDVVIRALYQQTGGVTTLLTDPSLPIPQGSEKTADITNLGLTPLSGSIIIAATERGITSQGVEEIQPPSQPPPGSPDTSTLTIGPLMLAFNSLNWASTTKQGTIGTWEQTWTISSSNYCAWRLTLTNVDDKNRSLTISSFSGFTLSKVGSPTMTTWYLKDTQDTASWNSTITVIFLWNDPTSHTQAVKPTNNGGINNVFLTIFGTFSDGEEFAQTVPFQAITVT